MRFLIVNNDQEFKIALEEFIACSPLISKDDIEVLEYERENFSEECGFVAPLYAENISLVSGYSNKGKNIFITITDGDIDEIAFLIRELEGLNSSDVDWGEMQKITASSFVDNGIHGIYFGRLKQYEFFESFPDCFNFDGEEYQIKTMLFLSKYETELYESNLDDFFEQISTKDSVKFNQNKL